jgi:hypothetical protein
VIIGVSGKYKHYFMRRTFLLILLTLGLSCNRDNLTINKKHVNARVMLSSCGGTVLQFTDLSEPIGEDWLWFKNISGPLDTSNPAQIYPRCVTATNVPKERQTIGDTLKFTYMEPTGSSSVVCSIGGLPKTYISIDNLENR